MTQVDLVQAYARHKDAAAFGAIVKQYQRLIFATCRRNLGNPLDVEDAVQETFLRLAQRAAELHTNLGGWLHRCAVNVSIDMNRRRATRQRNEAAAAQPAATDEPQRQLAELREHLDAALQKLDDPSRELIINRFFLGRPQVDLAAEAGVAPSTISLRLDKAIAALRDHLQSLGCAGLSAGGVAALARTMDAEHTSAQVPQTLTANVMKIGLSGVSGGVGASAALKFLLAFAALLVVSGGGGLWLWLRQNPPAAQIAPPAIMPAAGPSPTAMSINANNLGAVTAPGWHADAAPNIQAVLAGRVTDDQGNPISGATVGLERPPSVRNQMTTKTDAQGNYAFRALRGDAGDFQVSINADGYMPIEVYRNASPVLQLSATSQARRDYVLERGARVEVTVTDANRSPIKTNVEWGLAGDPQHGTGDRATTDALGVAVLTLPMSNDGFTIAAVKDGYAPAHALIHTNASAGVQRLHLVLSPGVSVHGVAICSDGKPATGWMIDATPDWWNSNNIPKESPIGPDGSFTLNDIAPGRYQLWLWKSNRGTSITTMTLPTTQPLALHLPMPSPASLVQVSGRVRISGDPPSYVEVEIIGHDQGLFVQSAMIQFFGGRAADGSRLSQNEGQYSFEAPPGNYTLRFDSPTIASATIDDVKLPGLIPTITLNIIGKPHISGEVTDAANNTITHFAIRLRKLQTLDGGPNYTQSYGWTQVSNAEGHFDIDCVGPGVYQVQASADGYAWLWSAPVRLEKQQMTQDVRLRLTAGGSLAGTVLDPAGKPIAGAKVIALSMARTLAMGLGDQTRFDGEAGAVLTDSAGKFLLPHLQAGNETLKITDRDFAPVIASGFQIADGMRAGAGMLTLHVGGAVEGTIFDALGKPQPGVALLFNDAEGYSGLEDEGVIAKTTSDSAGHYRVDHLPQQPIWINRADRWQTPGVLRRVARPLDEKTAHLDFGGKAPVTGRLVIGTTPYANKPLTLAMGSVYSAPVIASTSTDSDGNFTIFGPPVGHYTLYYQSQEQNISLTPLREVEISGQPTDLGTLGGEARDVVIRISADDPADLTLIRDVEVDVDPHQRFWLEPIARARPEQDHWRAQAIPAGHYRIGVAFNDPSHVGFALPFEQTPGAGQTNLTMHLPRLTATLTLINTQTAGDRTQHVVVRSDDWTVDGGIALDPDGKGRAKLPPGTYRIFDQTTVTPRADMEALGLADGATREIRHDFSESDAETEKLLGISIWSADGVLFTQTQPRLLDAQGKTIPPAASDGVVKLFRAPPGSYRVIVDRLGGAPLSQSIEVPTTQPAEGEKTIDVVLP